MFADLVTTGADRFAALLLDVVGKSLLLILLGAVGVWAARRHSAALRHLCWTCLLAALLALPLLTAVMPAWPVVPRWLADRRPAAASTATAIRDLDKHRESTPTPPAPDRPTGATPPPAPQVASSPARLHPDLDVSSLASSPPQDRATGLDETNESASATPRAQLAARGPHAALLVTGLWLCGAVLLGVRLLLSTLWLRRLERSCSRSASGPWPGELAAAMRVVGLRRSPKLLLVERDTLPMAWGVVRGRVLLPSTASEWSTAQRHEVLVHELAHLRRRDPLANWIAELARVVYWFHPLVWLARRWQAVECERACDDAVLLAGVDGPSYARTLLSVVAARPAPLIAASMSSVAPFEGRLREILDARRPRRPLRTTALIVAFLLGTAAALGVAMLAPTLAAKADEPPQDKTSPTDPPPLPGVVTDKQRPPAAAAAANQGCSLAGHVLDIKGRIIPGARIELWRHDGLEKRDLLAARTPRPTSSDSGFFEIRDLPEGEYFVSATLEAVGERGPYSIWSDRTLVELTPTDCAYVRPRLVVPVPPEETPELVYLTSGSPGDTGTWGAWQFDPRVAQAAGHRPERRRGEPLVWSDAIHGLQARLVLDVANEGEPGARRATLVLRNALADRMLGLRRWKDREQFAFEFLGPDGKTERLDVDVWEHLGERAHHIWNGIYLRPRDEYEIPLGTLTLPSFALSEGDPKRLRAGMSVRAGLQLYSGNEAADAIRTDQAFLSCRVTSAWLPLAPPPAQEELANGVVTILVTDEASGAPVADSIAIPGIESMLGNEGEPEALAQWQPHLLTTGGPGRIVWPLKRTYASFRLRIEAPGFRPVLTQLIRRADGPLTLAVPMRRDGGVACRALLPDGRPAANAQVGVALPARTLQLRGRRLVAPPLSEKTFRTTTDAWREPLVLQADRDGWFTLPPEASQALVFIAHPQGCLHFRRDSLETPRTLTLRPWGRIEGRAEWGGEPGAGLQIGMSFSHPNPEWIPLISGMAKTTSDDQGKFVFDDVPHGWAQVSSLQAVDGAGGNPPLLGFSRPTLQVWVAGETTSVVIGGRGRPLKGEFAGRDNWQGVRLKLFPVAPRPGDSELWRSYAEFAKTRIGQLYHREVELAPDGTFRLEQVLADRYQWTLHGPGGAVIAGGRFEVPATNSGASDEPADMGRVVVGQ